jgi:F-type H+-transporting ATPase subunit b
VLAAIFTFLAEEAGATAEAAGDEIGNLTPKPAELLIGVVAFAVFFFFLWKWVLPRANQVLEERREQIQGNLEKAEQTRREADTQLEDYRAQLANAREEANRIIEEARQTAEHLRQDIQARAEAEAQSTVVRAQEEIRAERDRVFQDLRGQVGEIAVALAGRVVGASLDEEAHRRLIDEYIDEVGAAGNGRH